MSDEVDKCLPIDNEFTPLPDPPPTPIVYDHSTPPHRVARIKIDKYHPNRLAVDIHAGFCRFYADRGIAPPSVSTTFLEEQTDLVNWLHICETKGWLPLPIKRNLDRASSPWS